MNKRTRAAAVLALLTAIAIPVTGKILTSTDSALVVAVAASPSVTFAPTTEPAITATSVPTTTVAPAPASVTDPAAAPVSAPAAPPAVKSTSSTTSVPKASTSTTTSKPAITSKSVTSSSTTTRATTSTTSAAPTTTKPKTAPSITSKSCYVDSVLGGAVMKVYVSDPDGVGFTLRVTLNSKTQTFDRASHSQPFKFFLIGATSVTVCQASLV